MTAEKRSSDAAVAATATPAKKQRLTKEEKAAAKPPPPQDNPAGACDVYLSKKSRFCKGERQASSRYCGHHSEERVPCPINPKHTVKQKSLKEHLLVCSDRHMLPPEDQPYYKKGVNGVETPEAATETAAPAAAAAATTEVSAEEKAKADAAAATLLEETVAILARFAASESISEEILPWPPAGVAATEVVRSLGEENRVKADKHEGQIASLLGHLHKIDALPGRFVPVTFKGPTKRKAGAAPVPEASREREDKMKNYIEFGAGKGSLAVSVARVLHGEMAHVDEDTFEPEKMEGGRVVLIDRSNFRRKAIHPCFERVKIDLQDLVLNGLGMRDIVGFSKHLCGVATDFTIRCCTGGNSASSMHSLSIALCCHHRCEHAAYCNHGFLDAQGVTEKHFATLKKISSWTVDGEADAPAINDVPRHVWGRRAKRFLDQGRVLALRAAGFEVRLVHYVPMDTTPENCLLVAVKQQDS